MFSPPLGSGRRLVPLGHLQYQTHCAKAPSGAPTDGEGSSALAALPAWTRRPGPAPRASPEPQRSRSAAMAAVTIATARRQAPRRRRGGAAPPAAQPTAGSPADPRPPHAPAPRRAVRQEAGSPLPEETLASPFLQVSALRGAGGALLALGSCQYGEVLGGEHRIADAPPEHGLFTELGPFSPPDAPVTDR